MKKNIAILLSILSITLVLGGCGTKKATTIPKAPIKTVKVGDTVSSTVDPSANATLDKSTGNATDEQVAHAHATADELTEVVTNFVQVITTWDSKSADDTLAEIKEITTPDYYKSWIAIANSAKTMSATDYSKFKSIEISRIDATVSFTYNNKVYEKGNAAEVDYTYVITMKTGDKEEDTSYKYKAYLSKVNGKWIMNDALIQK